MAPSPLVLAFGDSLVAGHGLPVAEGFAAQLEGRLRKTHPRVCVVDAGRSGDTTVDALRRLPRVMSALATRPNLAIVQLGPNDVLRQVPPAATRTALAAILLEFERCGVPVIMTSVEPPAFLGDRARNYAGIQSDVAKTFGATLLPFFPPGVLGRPGLVLADRVHPNGRAIAAVVAALQPAVLDALARNSAPG